MTTKVIYPGTFDPITYGHIDIVERALRLFDKVIIGIAQNAAKKPLFTLEERIALVEKVFANNNKVQICSFSGLLIDLAREKNVMVILRGLRAISDFEYELQLANLNRSMEPKIDTIFLTPAEQYAYISANMIREISALNGDVSKFVPPIVLKALKNKIS
ncbi:MAG: pantetheine-phosphate adenylyltransferase [Gammaproteobacteria bacterium]|nr:pantetheine-phosphate adenylyltransferase [Gammaproteobacteria bacterium]